MGCLFLVLFIFCISVCWVFAVDKIAVGALLFFVIKTIHNMVGFGCVLWVFCGWCFLRVENAVYKIDFICSV